MKDKEFGIVVFSEVKSIGEGPVSFQKNPCKKESF
jgi:hypothetical protein